MSNPTNVPVPFASSEVEKRLLLQFSIHLSLSLQALELTINYVTSSVFACLLQKCIEKRLLLKFSIRLSLSLQELELTNHNES